MLLSGTAVSMQLQQIAELIDGNPVQADALAKAVNEAVSDTSKLAGLDENARLQLITSDLLPQISNDASVVTAAKALFDGTGIHPDFDRADLGFIIIMLLFF